MTLKEAVKIMYPDKYDEWWKGIDKDKDYQEKADKLLEEKELDECDVLLDIEGNPVPDKYACITSDNADYFVQDYEGDNYG